MSMTLTDVFPKVDYSKYVGEWVVVYEDKIIAHNRNLNKISPEIHACKGTPTLIKIPKGDSWTF